MLLNTYGEVPKEFCIFADQLSPTTWNNVTLPKSLTSGAYSQCSVDQQFAVKYAAGKANYLPFIPNNGTDLKFLSPYHLTAINSYKVEYNAELVRMDKFPFFPSRLSAIYAFGDYATCEKVAIKYGWKLAEVKRFIVAKENFFPRVIRVNMEIVSLMKYANRISMIDLETNDYIWTKYWQGESIPGMEALLSGGQRKVIPCEEILEYLIEGKVALID